MEVGRNKNSRWMMNGNGNKCGIQMAAGMGMGMNERTGMRGNGNEKLIPVHL
jgi:hypothetical protein